MSALKLFISTLCFSLMAIGCLKEEAIPYSYVVLIGQKTAPEWASLSVGDYLEGDAFLQAYSEAPFGSVEVYWDGKLKATFDRGGIMLSRNEGILRLSGSTFTELKFLLIKKRNKNNWEILDKEILDPGPLDLSIDIRKETKRLK